MTDTYAADKAHRLRIECDRLQRENHSLQKIANAAACLVCSPTWLGTTEEKRELLRVLKEEWFVMSNPDYVVNKQGDE